MANDYAMLTQEWEGWNYYSDGTVIGPDGTYYSGGQAVWSPDPAPTPEVGAGGGFNFGSSLDYLMRTAADTYKSRTLIQANQQGQRYVEGRAGVYGQPYGYGTANNGGLTMLLMVAGLVFLVAKG